MKIKLLLIVFLSSLLVSCKLSGIKGDGNLTEEEREIENFTKIDVSGNFDVEIYAGEKLSLKINADQNLLKYIKTKVKRNTLYIYSKENIRPREDLEVIVSVPQLEEIECSGMNDIYARGIETEFFRIDLSGAGNIEIEGIAERLKVDISGAADLSAKNFIVEDVSIDVSGAANAEIYAKNSVDADVSGAGNIELYGDAEDVNMDVSGAGSLVRK